MAPNVDWNALTVSDAEYVPQPARTRQENPLVSTVRECYGQGWKELPPQSNIPGEVRYDNNGLPKFDRHGNEIRYPSDLQSVESMLRNAANDEGYGISIRYREVPGDNSKSIVVFQVKDKRQRRNKKSENNSTDQGTTQSDAQEDTQESVQETPQEVTAKKGQDENPKPQGTGSKLPKK